VNRSSLNTQGFANAARPGAPGLSPYVAITPTHEAAGDRVLLTLLALGLMLLAFFVVLTSMSTLDQRRIRDVAQSVQVSFARPHKEDGDSGQASMNDSAQRAAVVVLRAAVADIFAGILPRDMTAASEKSDRVSQDRVEVDVPTSVFFAENEATLYPLPLLDKLVAVLSSPPAGYRMELVVRAASQTNGGVEQERLAALAVNLVQRGLAPTALSVGTLQDAKIAQGLVSRLRFTFLLLDADDDLAAVRMMKVAQ
jgi:hypothetical protein